MSLTVFKCFQTVRRDQSVFHTRANDTLNRACPQKNHINSTFVISKAVLYNDKWIDAR